MSQEFNIENFFRDSFDGHSVEPRNKVWNGISKKLWMRQLGDFFKMSFEGFQVSPSAAVWNSIARKLWFYNFIRFNPASFNAYYLGIAVTVITGIIISNSNSKNTQTLPDNSVSVNKALIQTDKQTGANTNTTIATNNSVQSNSNNTRNTPNTTQLVPATVTPVQKQNILTTNKKVIKESKENNKDNQLVQNTNNNEETGTPAFFKTPVQNTREESKDDKLIAFNTPAVTSTNSVQNSVSDLTGQSILLNLLQSRKSLLPLTPAADVLFPDTLGYNFFGAPIVLDRVHWSVDAWWSPIYSRTLFNERSTEFRNYTGMLKNASSEDITYASYGGDLNYSYKNWVFQAGLSYTELGQKIQIPATSSELRFSSSYNTFDNNILIHDTIWFIDLDSLLQNPADTVWIPKPVETWTIQKDSILIIKYDTLKTTTHHKISNRYMYFEIPIMAGYEVHRGKFSFALKGGVAAGFFIKSTGSVPSSNGYESVLLNNADQPYMKQNFSMLFSVGMNYHVTKKFAIFGEPYFRKNINSIFENRYIYAQRFQAFGVKFGMKYTFK